MERDNYYLKIADLSILIKSKFDIKIKRESENFIYDGKDADIIIELEEVSEPLKIDGRLVYDNTLIKFYETIDGLQREMSLFPKSEPFEWLISKDNKNYKLFYLECGKEELKYSNRILEDMNFPKLLNNNNGFLLHSSFIKWNNKAILFSAPSGTGKSTQADLWKKYENADIINGDRAGVRNLGKIWYAYGLPFAGSSEIYRNEGVQLSHIILLRQGKENKLRRVAPREAFVNLYRETIMQTWDDEFKENIVSMFNDLIQNINIYMYECLPDKSAVDFLKEQIQKDIL